MAMQATNAPRNVKHANKKPSTHQKVVKKQDAEKSLEQCYTTYFVPQQSTPENFRIFTLTDWAIPVSTGNHT